MEPGFWSMLAERPWVMLWRLLWVLPMMLAFCAFIVLLAIMYGTSFAEDKAQQVIYE